MFVTVGDLLQMTGQYNLKVVVLQGFSNAPVKQINPQMVDQVPVPHAHSVLVIKVTQL